MTSLKLRMYNAHYDINLSACVCVCSKYLMLWNMYQCAFVPVEAVGVVVGAYLCASNTAKSIRSRTIFQMLSLAIQVKGACI
jgi:hypothetical protein